jgi:nitrite reductase/ring-hydroxylating ferredoxin subunit
MADFVRVAPVRDIPAGTAKRIDHAGRKIAVFNVAGAFYAIDDTCPHRGGPLSEGTVSDTTVTCPWHGAVFCLATGRVQQGPAETGVRCYAVRASGDAVELDVAGAPEGAVPVRRRARSVKNYLAVGAVAVLAVAVWVAHGAVRAGLYLRDRFKRPGR